MPKFITIGYGDETGYNQTAQTVRDAAHAHDAKLLAAGAVMGIAGTPVQVRNHNDSGVKTTQGPYLRADLPIAGFGIVEADTLDEAIALAAQSPCAVAQGVIEVWPLQEG